MSNVQALVVETNIPIPSHGYRNKYAEVLAKFTVGSSVAFSDMKRATAFAYACRKVNFKTLRRTVNGVTRVWRTA